MNTAEQRIVIDKLLDIHNVLTKNELKETDELRTLVERYATHGKKTLYSDHKAFLASMNTILDLLTKILVPLSLESSQVPIGERFTGAIFKAVRQYEYHDKMARDGQSAGLNVNERLRERKSADAIRTTHEFQLFYYMDSVKSFIEKGGY